MIESQLLIFNIIQYQAVNYVVIYLLKMQKMSLKVLKGILDARKILKNKTRLTFQKVVLLVFVVIAARSLKFQLSYTNQI